MLRATLLLIAVFLVGCFHTRSLGYEPGDEALVEQEVLGRTTRYFIDVDGAAEPTRLRVRLLAVEAIRERMRATHERLERVEITQSWPPPLGWVVSGETVEKTIDTDGLLPGAWSEPSERFDVTSVSGQIFEVVLDAAEPRRITAAESGWAILSVPDRAARGLVIRATTPCGTLTRRVEPR